jgi:hypothetical protein
LLEIVKTPNVTPLICGVKYSFTLVVVPAESVRGSLVFPSTENELGEKANSEITTGAELWLTSEIAEVADVPTVTVPKSTLVGVTEKVPAAAGDDFLLLLVTNPPQPEMETHATTAVRTAADTAETLDFERAEFA